MHFSFALKLKSFNSSESEVSESWRNALIVHLLGDGSRWKPKERAVNRKT